MATGKNTAMNKNNIGTTGNLPSGSKSTEGEVEFLPKATSFPGRTQKDNIKGDSYVGGSDRVNDIPFLPKKIAPITGGKKK